MSAARDLEVDAWISTIRFMETGVLSYVLRDDCALLAVCCIVQACLPIV